MAKEKSILKKKQDELTVADNLKITAGVSAVGMVIALAPVGLVYALAKIEELREKMRLEAENSDEE